MGDLGIWRGLASKFTSGFLWNSMATLLGQGGTFFSSIIIARFLGIEDFGRFSLVALTIQTGANVATMGTGSMAAVLVAQNRTANPPRVAEILDSCFKCVLASGAITAIGVFVLAHFVSKSIYSVPDMTIPLMLGSVAILFLAITNFHLGALAGLGDFRGLAIITAFGGIGTLTLITGAAAQFGIRGASFAWTINAGIQMTIAAIRLRMKMHQSKIPPVDGAHKLDSILFAKYLMPAAISGAITMPVIWTVNALLARQTDGVTAVAIFMAANTLRALTLVTPNVINAVGSSLLNHQKGMNEPSMFRKIYGINLLLMAFAALTGAIILWLFGKSLLCVMGTSFVPSYNIFLILSISIITETLATGCYQCLVSKGLIWESLFKVTILRDGLYLLLSLIFAPKYGASGIAWSYVFSSATALASVNLIIYKRKLLSDKEILR